MEKRAAAVSGGKLVRRIKLFSGMDIYSIQDYLEKMAAKGLIFEKRQYGFVYCFREDEPRKLHYCIDISGKASEFDGVFMSSELQEYVECCQQCGWQYIWSDNEFIFFSTDKDEAEPIHTDSEIQLNTINENMKGNNLGLLVLAVLGSINAISGYRSSNPVNIIQNGAGIILYGFVAVFILVYLCRYLWFYFRNKRRTADGMPVSFFSKRGSQIFRGCIIIIIAIFVAQYFSDMIESVEGIGLTLCIAGCFLAVYILYRVFFGKKVHEKGRGWTICGAVLISAAVIGCVLVVLLISIYKTNNSTTAKIEYYDEIEKCNVTEYVEHDKLPLVLENMGVSVKGAIGDSRYDNSAHSLLGSIIDCTQTVYVKDGPYAELEYSLTTCRFGWVKSFILKKYLDEKGNWNSLKFKNITEAERDMWHAERVYEGINKSSYVRLVLYENSILYISNNQVDYCLQNTKAVIDALDLQ